MRTPSALPGWIAAPVLRSLGVPAPLRNVIGGSSPSAVGESLLRSMVGDLLGGLGRRIFGGGSGSERGATAAQPLYTQDVGVTALLSELLNATRALQLRSLGSGVDELSAELSLSRMRAGLEAAHG